MERPRFASRTEYGARFTDLAYWRPYIAAICERHGLPRDPISAGLPGTNVVFIVGDHVVKLYPELFDGARSMPVERACYALIAQAGGIPAPALVAEGELFDTAGGWPWPYLVTTRLPGRSLGEEAAVGVDNLRVLAGWLADLLAQLHKLPLSHSTALRPEWSAFEAFLQAQRTDAVRHHEQAQILPPHLITQLEAYLPPASALIDQSMPPFLIHADLNADHVLGGWEGPRWQPSGIIDFGDARVGDRAYDLVALHLGLFHTDKRLLRVFLDAYPDPTLRAALPRRAMAMTLLHEFNVLDGLQQQIAGVATLADLADLIWNLDMPGLTA